jgi:hypothetical protein
MWLSRQMKAPAPTADADLGMTTITGDSVGVVTRGEVRALPVYGPGGYVWMPESGAAVLVIKGGPGGEEQCVAGQQQALIPEGMGPGEVYLFTPAETACTCAAAARSSCRAKCASRAA